MVHKETVDSSCPMENTQVDSKENSIYCNLCRKQMKSDYCFCLLKKSIKCQLCESVFSNLHDFKLHMKFHQVLKVPKKSNCNNNTSYGTTPLKDDSTRTSDYLSSHEITSTPNNCSLIKIIISEKKRTPTAEMRKSCLKCGESFNNKFNLLTHSLCHLDKDLDNKEYRCDKCHRDFSSASRLSIHISCMHVKNKKYKCCVCKKGFSTSSTLEAHQRLHRGIKPYKCDECGKTYSQSGNLAYHKSTHIGIKSFVCHLCGKAFLTAGILANHERRHSGLKPFVCDVCGRGFADNYSMNSHKIVHTGIRSYMCDCCGKAFVHKHTLASHKRIHSGEKKYKCTICERTFTQLSTMIQHKNTHTGEKAYSCICGKSYTQQSSLARHKRIHDGTIDSFACQICNKKFGYKSTLYKHHRKSHGVHKLESFYLENNSTPNINI